VWGADRVLAVEGSVLHCREVFDLAPAVRFGVEFFCQTQCFHYLVLESQPPHKIVNLIFKLVIVNNKLTIVGELTF